MAEYVKKTDNPNMGRPKLEINWTQFETACSLMATKEEICALFGISLTTLERRVKEKYDDTFEGVLEKSGATAKISLRRSQFNLAKTNAAVCIFLGKQYLGQKDIHGVELGTLKIEDDWGDNDELDKPS
jgi:hypothetical protein